MIRIMDPIEAVGAKLPSGADIIKPILLCKIWPKLDMKINRAWYIPTNRHQTS